jgi:hypothetical protein
MHATTTPLVEPSQSPTTGLNGISVPEGERTPFLAKWSGLNPKVAVELKQRNCDYHITITGAPYAEKKRLAKAILSLIVSDPAVEIDECSALLYRACGSPPSS